MARGSRHHRRMQQHDFQRVFRDGIRSANQRFVVLGRENGLNHGRLGLAISKKNTPRAVDRNRIKRLVRESFRKHQQELGNIDVVVINRTAVQSLSNGEIFEHLQRHWHRLMQKLVQKRSSSHG